MKSQLEASSKTLFAGCQYCRTEVYNGKNGEFYPPAPWAPNTNRATCYSCKYKHQPDQD